MFRKKGEKFDKTEYGLDVVTGTSETELNCFFFFFFWWWWKMFKLNLIVKIKTILYTQRIHCCWYFRLFQTHRIIYVWYVHTGLLMSPLNLFSFSFLIYFPISFGFPLFYSRPSTLVYLVLSSWYFVTLCFYLCHPIYNSLHFRLLYRLNNITTGYGVLLFFLHKFTRVTPNKWHKTHTHTHTCTNSDNHQSLMGNEWPRCAINGLEDVLCPLNWNATKQCIFSDVHGPSSSNKLFRKEEIMKMTKRKELQKEERERGKTLYWFEIIYAIGLTLRFNSILKWIVWRMNERYASSFSSLWQLKDPWREKLMWSIVFEAEPNYYVFSVHLIQYSVPLKRDVAKKKC